VRIFEVELAGRRVIRMTSVDLVGNGEARFIVWSAWADDSPIPSGHAVSFPASTWPELRNALDALETEK
jgi:hypothetical protein